MHRPRRILSIHYIRIQVANRTRSPVQARAGAEGGSGRREGR